MLYGYYSAQQEAANGYFIYASKNGPVKITEVSSNKYTTFPNKKIGFKDTEYMGVVEGCIKSYPIRPIQAKLLRYNLLL